MYHYKTCGLDGIYLKNGYEVTETAEGSAVSIHDIYSLHRVIAKGLIEKASPLTGREFRFLRIEMDMSQRAVGDLMDKTDQIIAKWEKGQNKIPVLADKAMRDLYMDSIGESPIAGLLKRFKELDREIHELEFQLSETDDGWQLDRCA